MPRSAPGPSAASAPTRDLRLSDLWKLYGEVEAVRGLDLHVEPGDMVSLIGPSGCGKTTTLRMIAGLEKPTRGRITASDLVLSDDSRVVPPELRDMGMVFQTYALWPHMSAARNIGYGLRRKGMNRAEVDARVDEVLRLVNMEQYGERYPSQLSGGQQQRVALARAIASQPRILLFDEPLSNLDAVLREQMRFEIRSLQQRLGITSIYVTHSQEEALALSDHIAVMNHGSIVQAGTPQQIYDTPRTEFVAGFIGLANILELQGAAACGNGICGRLPGGDLVTARAGFANRPSKERVKLSVRPSEISILGDAAASGTPGWNRLAGRVGSTVFTGGVVDYFVRLRNDANLVLRIQAVPPKRAEQGDDVVLEFDPSRTVILED
jgi:iron(III) transport system ATP-binding protein